MYCRYCGKQIEDDSTFCRYCGRDQHEGEYKQKDPEKRGLLTRFTALPRNIQYVAMAYVLLLLIWLCVIVVNINDHYLAENCLFPAILTTIVIPFIIACVWYIVNQNKKKAKTTPVSAQPDTTTIGTTSTMGTKATIGTESVLQSPQTPAIPKINTTFAPQENDEVEKTMLLLDFARTYGKMQIVRADIGKYNERTYCTFAKNGTSVNVDFSEHIGVLSSGEISERKYSLCVLKYKSGHFVLDSLENISAADLK